MMSLMISSCASITYQQVYEANKGLDFRQGEWLVNAVESDFQGKSKIALTSMLMDQLRELVGDSVYFIDDVQFDYLVPENIQFNLSHETASILNKTSSYDFLVNLKAQQNRNDLSDIIFSPPEVYSKSESEVTLVVYDIHTGQKIYSQRIIASVALDEEDEDTKFAKSSHSLVYKALRKGLKDLRKYSTTK